MDISLSIYINNCMFKYKSKGGALIIYICTARGSNFGGEQISPPSPPTQGRRSCVPPALLHNECSLSPRGSSGRGLGFDHSSQSSLEFKERVEQYV